MTVRFMKGTSIAELEREMQQVPGRVKADSSGAGRLERQRGLEAAGMSMCGEQKKNRVGTAICIPQRMRKCLLHSIRFYSDC